MTPEHWAAQLKTHAQRLPICVDLDKTLIQWDLSVHGWKILWKRSRWIAIVAGFRMVCGQRASAKKMVAQQVLIDPQLLPYRANLVNALVMLAQNGWHLYLVTGSHQLYADAVVKHCTWFRGAFGSKDSENLVGMRKAAFLNKTFGQKQFIYLGDSRKDCFVWKSAKQCVGINPSWRVRGWLKRQPHYCILEIPDV